MQEAEPHPLGTIQVFSRGEKVFFCGFFFFLEEKKKSIQRKIEKKIEKLDLKKRKRHGNQGGFY